MQAIATARSTSGVVTATRVTRRRKNCVPVVEYQYQVAGQSFRGSRVAPLSWGYFFKEGAEAPARRYSPGQKVTVHYAPGKPQDAFLETKVDYQPSGLCLAFGLLALGTLWHNLTSRKPFPGSPG